MFSSVPIIDLIDDLQPGDIVLRQQVFSVEIVIQGEDIIRDLGVTRTKQLPVGVDPAVPTRMNLR